MKTTKGLCLGLWIASSLCAGARADEAGDRVIRELDSVTDARTSRSVVRQTITTTGGEERAFTLELSSAEGGDPLLLSYREPRRVKGLSFLILDGDTWTYNPKTSRVRKLTSSTRKRRVNGSDFTYEDFGAGSMGDDFDATHAGEEEVGGALCDKLVLVPRPDGPAYSKVEAWIARAPRVLVRADYYDEEGAPLKRLTTADVRVVSEVATPHRYLMQSLVGSQRTSMEVLEIHYDEELPAGTFTLDNLQRQ